MLYLIVKYLNVYDLVYSLIDIDERFAQMAVDPLYTCHLDMTVITMKSYFDYSYSIDETVLSRICQTILPKISDRVNKLTIEQNSMERILFTFNYPQLSSLSLINCQEEILLRYLKGKLFKEFLFFIFIKPIDLLFVFVLSIKDHSVLRELVTEQITDLSIDIKQERRSEEQERPSMAFEQILLQSKRLTHLNVCQLFPHSTTSICIFGLPSRYLWSSSLTQLRINVLTFGDCLCLLDGRLPHLSKLIINVKEFSSKYHLSHFIKVKTFLFLTNKILFEIYHSRNFRD